MSRIGVVTCAGDAVDPDSPLLLDALDAVGLDAQLAVWDDPSVDWESYDLAVIRSTWDYAPRRAQFLAWARGVARLANPYPVLEYSSDKCYLADLSARGQHVVPSFFCDVGDEPVFPDGDFVVKPRVGAGSIDAHRYGAAGHDRARAHVAELHARGRDVLIQPYVASVDEVGERALIFIDGSFSHAMTKGAMLNVAPGRRDASFRREQMSRAEAEPEAVAFATQILDAGGFAGLLYARVDAVRLDGRWALMELELVEPSLFLSFEPGAPARLAGAIKRRVA